MALSIRAAGSWVTLKGLHVRVGGSWLNAKTVYQRINGVWTAVWTAMTASCTGFGTAGNSVSRTVSVTGGTAPYSIGTVTFAVTTGLTPGFGKNGLTLTLNRPAAGQHDGSVTIQVLDSAGNTATATTTYSFVAL